MDVSTHDAVKFSMAWSFRTGGFFSSVAKPKPPITSMKSVRSDLSPDWQILPSAILEGPFPRHPKSNGFE